MRTRYKILIYWTTALFMVSIHVIFYKWFNTESLWTINRTLQALLAGVYGMSFAIGLKLIVDHYYCRYDNKLLRYIKKNVDDRVGK